MWKLYLPPMLPRWFPSIILSLYIPCHSMSWWHRHGWALLLFQKRRRHSFWARPSAKTCISLRWTREGILRLALRKLNKPVWKLGVRFNMSLPFIWIHLNVGTLAFCTVRQNSLNDSIQKMDIHGVWPGGQRSASQPGLVVFTATPCIRCYQAHRGLGTV